MANRQHWPIQATTNEAKSVYGSFVGKAAVAPTTVGGDVLSVARSGTGVLVATLAHKYPSTLFPDVKVVGPTKLTAVITAIDWTVPSITMELQVGAGTATDATTSDTVYIRLDAKNSGI